YYLSLLLEYGFLGFLLFMLFWICVSWKAFIAYIDAREGDALFAGPLCCALVNFTVVKGVLSSEANMPLAFLLAGCFVGLTWQQRNQEKTAKPVPRGFAPAAAAAIPAQ
ncbi:MAG: hypothetical protein RL490_1638, partial [Pseudomonadota bacterium]